ncbi:MAG: type II/IV secretion system ATPase subunit [archaeon]|nr:type II/IV secretion system ATPase subunit [archaeon]
MTITRAKALNLKKCVKTFKSRYREYLERHRQKGPVGQGNIDVDIINQLIPALKGMQSPQGPKKKRKTREKDYKVVSLSDVEKTKGDGIEVDYAEFRNVDVDYPLTHMLSAGDEPIYAWARIAWNPELNSLEYTVVEPEITEIEKKSISRIKNAIEEKINVHFESVHQTAAESYLEHLIDQIIRQYEMRLTPEQRQKYDYYLLRSFVELDQLQPLMNDPNIEDISCDGVNIPVFVYHRNPKFGSLKTSVVFRSKEELDDFVMKLAQRCGKTISVAEPVLQGALPDGSRVQATLETDIAKRGSNFTIRKFTKEPMTPIHLMEYGTLDAKVLAYLWFVIEHNKSILVCGPTASGKTTLLNALSLFIRPSMKIVSIEDTPELRLPHMHWIPEIAREGISSYTGGGERRLGEVSMFDLLRGALRQRPDYLIVGEVRGKEAFILFQAMATGHAGMSTMHADSLEKVIDRLTTPPIQLPSSLLETLDLIVFAKRLRYRNHNVRRTTEVHEINYYDSDDKYLDSSRVFKWNASLDTFMFDEDSELLGRLCRDEGITESKLKSEILNRIKVLKWMKANEIRDYRQVGEIMYRYYSNPQEVMNIIEAE